MSNCVEIDKEKCVGCRACIKECPYHALEIVDGKANMVLGKCMECGHCVAVCPRAAVKMNGYDMSEVKEYDRNEFEISPEVFLNNVKFRRSIRHYKDIPVEHEKIQQILMPEDILLQEAISSQ